MTDTFEDLKIAPELVAGAGTLGWDAPSGLQRDAMAVIRRGNNVVLHASAGSGVVGAYGLGVLDRLTGSEAPADGPRALVLVPDAHAASATADSLAALAAASDLAVRAAGPGWGAGPAHLLVASANTALDAVRTSTLKLDGLTTLVVDGADLLADTDQWSALETLVDSIPGDAQRVLVAGRFDGTIDGFIERHVRKAMTVPPRAEAKEPDGPGVRYAVVPESAKTAAAIRILGGMEQEQVAVVCRTLDRAEQVTRALAGRGLLGRDGPRITVLPRTEADQRSVQAGVVSYDVPFDADELEALHAGGGAVLVTPRERAHLLRIAARAGVRTEAAPVPEPAGSPVDRIRDELLELAGGDLAPELALIEPLLDRVPATVLAAAALRLGRSAPARVRAEQTATPGAAAPGRSAAPPPNAGTWVHLFVSIGNRDGVGPGDIVGAITGEAGISGDKVGKIDIRESHSTVEVATDAAPGVIEALNGRSLKGRSLRVDYDRKDRGAARGGGRGGEQPRGGTGRSPGRGGRPGGTGRKPGGTGRKPGGTGRKPGGRPPRS